MYIVTRVCVSVPRRIPTPLHGPGCNLERGCPLVVHYWADLQSVHGFRCYDNIAPNAKCQRVLVLALCLVDWVTDSISMHTLLVLPGPLKWSVTIWHSTKRMWNLLCTLRKCSVNLACSKGIYLIIQQKCAYHNPIKRCVTAAKAGAISVKQRAGNDQITARTD